MIENGAATLVKPFAATPVPVAPFKFTVTSNKRSKVFLAPVGVVTLMLGESPLHIAGKLFTNAACGVGSKSIDIVLVGPEAHPLSLGVIVYTMVLKEFVLFVSVPELTWNGAVIPFLPDAASPVPVTPAGKLTVTSKVRFAGTLTILGVVKSITGVPPLHTTGVVVVGKSACGVGSSVTKTD